MKPRQAFGLTVRVFGLIFILTGLVSLLTGLVSVISPIYRDYMYDSQFSQNWRFFLFGFLFALLGYVNIRCARHITRLAYKEDDHDA